MASSALAHAPMRRRQALTWMAVAGLLGEPVRLAAAPIALPAGRELRVLIEPESASGLRMVQTLKTRYPALVVDADPRVLEARKGPALYVAVGASALHRGMGIDGKSPLIACLTSSQRYRQLMGAESAEVRDKAQTSCVFADAPVLAQFQLMAALFERRVAVGVLLSESSSYMERSLRQAATQMGMALTVTTVDTGADPVRGLTRLGAVQVLLAVPDGTLYTPEALRAVLESSYRRGLPVIGFSAATVAAGTLATAYCAVDDVAADVMDLIDAWATVGGGVLPEPRWARYWRVAINETVARSMGVSVSDKVRAMASSPPGGRPA